MKISFPLAAILAFAVTMIGALPAAAVEPGSPVGLWKTIDDRTGKARGLVRIWEQDGALYGRIEKGLASPNEGPSVCVKCKDDRKDQPMIGLVILRGMKYEDGKYGGGDILDPESGSVYNCSLRLEENGTRLVVRGYVGIPMLGRSQTWQREE